MRVRHAIGIAVTSALLSPTITPGFVGGAATVASQAPQVPSEGAAPVKKASPQRGVAELGYMQSAKLRRQRPLSRPSR